ncbi:MAG TPA: bifunctional diaminohydroxyphosphoribosylaminopyrimidine deaminase/5-amino-6-(5-phosphoribosylamino)uracil reductase RibD [Syntrophomonas sp.]|nr:bifunctional diaminohydroxyphosphoribosylaminopyrimidine deaminase/5-amino-6-(5-phosphoribosylamino)uracil reductase RibD [Syntrophomonas sp.]
MNDDDKQYMQRALDLAAIAQGKTSPNPLVGAVIVKDGRIVGEGYHHQAGTPHAEVHALAQAGEQARGATIYVSLEPCSHYGCTPPCADALIEAGIKKAVVAVLDPNPLVAGRGLQKLKDAGIEVELGILEEEAQKLNQPFFKYISTHRPLVAIKTAMTLDGKIAAVSGDSRWITAEDARAYVHQLRGMYDAVLVGIGTVLQDDPQLNVRLENGDYCNPARVVLDSSLQIPLHSHIVAGSGDQRSIIFCDHDASLDRQGRLEEAGCEVFRVNRAEGGLALNEVLDILGNLKLCSLLVEGGGAVNASLLENKLVDKVYWFIAPKIIGGRTAPTPVGGKGLRFMEEAIVLETVELKRFSRDILITGNIKK